MPLILQSSHALKPKMWKTLILRHCLAAACLWHRWRRLGAALTCAIPNSTWGGSEQVPEHRHGCSLAGPPQSIWSPLWGHRQSAALLFVRRCITNWKSPPDPLKQFAGFSVLPEVRKAAAREKRGQSQCTLLYPQDSRAQKVSSNKGRKLCDGKVGIMALGHSAYSLPVSLMLTCPASVSSHTW